MVNFTRKILKDKSMGNSLKLFLELVLYNRENKISQGIAGEMKMTDHEDHIISPRKFHNP